jgi:hypothetical protein
MCSSNQHNICMPGMNRYAVYYIQHSHYMHDSDACC